jgi:hypothetical protein
MDCGVSITIKDYHNGGGDLTLKLTGVQYSEKASNSGRVQLIVYRKPDQHSSRLGMFAFLRNTQPGYQSLGFSQLTLNSMQCNEDGAFLSLATNVYFDVFVESAKAFGAEEMLTFVARRKTVEFRIP